MKKIGWKAVGYFALGFFIAAQGWSGLPSEWHVALGLLTALIAWAVYRERKPQA